MRRCTFLTVPLSSFENSMFIAEIPDGVLESEYYHLLKPLFIQYYQRRAEQLINERVRRYMKHFDELPKKIFIQSMKNK